MHYFLSAIKKSRKMNVIDTSVVYYKHITIVNYDSSIINKFEASLTANARIVIYDCPMFIV
jgi:hypothetical protein